jgi:hygromycin-B 7''-O-kinase
VALRLQAGRQSVIDQGLSLLPSIASLDDYRPLYRQESVWLPAMRAICRRHGLDADSLRFAPPGSNVVFWVERDKLIKLHAPMWREDAAREALVLRALEGQSDFAAPCVLGEGDVEGWPYLILTRLSGEPLDAIWESLSAAEREGIAASLGRLMAALCRVPTQGLAALDVDWPRWIAGQMQGCVARQAKLGASAEWQREIGAFLAELPPLVEPDFRPVLLNADLNPEHLFCERASEGWRVSGVIDFGDAMLGHAHYEFVAPGFIMRESARLRRAMLLAYGYPAEALDENLSRRLMAYTLLHHFANLPEALAMFDPPPLSLAELERALWGFF